MSKIIEALEKAKREGILESTTVALEERGRHAPADGSEGGKGPERRKRNGAPILREAVTLDPRAVQGVDSRIFALREPRSVVVEQYRSLRSRLERLNATTTAQVLAITSAVKGEGKSVTAVNLALVMAGNANRDVLLVDADFRRPNVHALLDLPLSPGLSDYLQGAASEEDIVRRTPFFGLQVVTAGNAEGHPAELLASPEFAAFLAAARGRFDYVIVDTPPIHPISDVNFLVEFVDGVLMVIRAGKTLKHMVQQSAESLPPGKVLGTILNRAEEPGHGYSYKKGYYYYSSYEEAKPKQR
ncbi:MAG: CpsD/CapB family tyrosine-protein kinase [Deltaproteobacteria bacterium]|nr:CpsD/CapB family tyrosine-protein kinase [Deltaproteobacteria bacterium]